MNLIHDGGSNIKKNVLRASLDSLGVWKAKFAKNAAPFKERIGGISKEAAIIDGKVWVFSIHSTISADLFTAVSIPKNYYKVSAKDIIGVYVKNLNAERENEMEQEALIKVHKQLYSSGTTAID